MATTRPSPFAKSRPASSSATGGDAVASGGTMGSRKLPGPQGARQPLGEGAELVEGGAAHVDRLARAVRAHALEDAATRQRVEGGREGGRIPALAARHIAEQLAARERLARASHQLARGAELRVAEDRLERRRVRLEQSARQVGQAAQVGPPLLAGPPGAVVALDDAEPLEVVEVGV